VNITGFFHFNNIARPLSVFETINFSLYRKTVFNFHLEFKSKHEITGIKNTCQDSE